MDSVKSYSTPLETAKELADYIRKKINDSQDSFFMAVSGGSTPRMLFEALAGMNEQINWSNLQLYWVDERCVSPKHEESNYKMTKEALLDKVSIPTENIHRIHGELIEEEEALAYYTIMLKKLPQRVDVPVFDLVILGMGEDGHTASIFPTQMHLLTEQCPAAIGTKPHSGQKRITLTGPTIMEATELIFHVTGKSKAVVLNKILSRAENYKDYPSSWFLSHSNLSWFLDHDALPA